MAEDTDAAFADAMLALEQDPALAAALASRGAEWARERFDWTRVGRDAEAVYDRACGISGSAPGRP